MGELLKCYIYYYEFTFLTPLKKCLSGLTIDSTLKILKLKRRFIRFFEKNLQIFYKTGYTVPRNGVRTRISAFKTNFT